MKYCWLFYRTRFAPKAYYEAPPPPNLLPVTNLGAFLGPLPGASWRRLAEILQALVTMQIDPDLADTVVFQAGVQLVLQPAPDGMRV